MMTSARVFLASLATLLLVYLLPQGYWLIADKYQRNPMLSYSCIVEDFVQIGFEGRKPVYLDHKGQPITRSEYEALTPFSSWIQLSKEGRLPSIIQQQSITPQSIKKAQAHLRLPASLFDMPSITLIPLFDGASTRARLEFPGDYLRIGKTVEFIEVESNRVLPEKSALFAKAFAEAGLILPITAAGFNPTTLKPYDEACYVSDAARRLFHVANLGGRPRVTPIPLQFEGNELRVTKLFVMEQENREWRALLLDEQSRLFLLAGPDRRLVFLPVTRFKPGLSSLSLRSDPLNIQITCTNPDSVESIALDKDYRLVKTHIQEFSQGDETWRDKLHDFLFPVVLSTESRGSGYYDWHFEWSGSQPFLVSLALAIGVFVRSLFQRQRPVLTASVTLLVLVAGPCGLIGALLSPRIQAKETGVSAAEPLNP